MVKKIIEIIFQILFGSDKRQNWYNHKSSEQYAEKIPYSYIESILDDEDVEVIDHVQIKFPVDIPDVTSEFGWRKIPHTKRHFHRGTDYTGRNTYSKAPCKCIVKKVLQPDPRYPYKFKYKNGKWHKLKVPRKRGWTPYVILVAYHNKEIKFADRHGKALVVPGQIIEEGENIIRIGSYGYSQGKHLHNEYMKLGPKKKWEKFDPDKLYRSMSNV